MYKVSNIGFFSPFNYCQLEKRLEMGNVCLVHGLNNITARHKVPQNIQKSLVMYSTFFSQ